MALEVLALLLVNHLGLYLNLLGVSMLNPSRGYLTPHSKYRKRLTCRKQT